LNLGVQRRQIHLANSEMEMVIKPKEFDQLEWLWNSEIELFNLD